MAIYLGIGVILWATSVFTNVMLDTDYGKSGYRHWSFWIGAVVTAMIWPIALVAAWREVTKAIKAQKEGS